MRDIKAPFGKHHEAEDWSQQWFGMKCNELSERLLLISGDIKQRQSANGEKTRIDRWCLARRTVPCLIGIPAGHPRIADGEPFFTSELYFIDPKRSLARSFSRWYELGEPVDPSYWEQRYPRFG